MRLLPDVKLCRNLWNPWRSKLRLTWLLVLLGLIMFCHNTSPGLQTSQCSFHIFSSFSLPKGHSVHVYLRRGCFEPFYTKALLVTSPHRNLNRPETENCLHCRKLQLSRTTALQLRWDHRNAVKARVVQSLSRSEINDNLLKIKLTSCFKEKPWKTKQLGLVDNWCLLILLYLSVWPMMPMPYGFLFWMDGLPFRGMLWWCQGAFRFGALQAA